ncbi:glycosyltransferase family 10 [Rhizobium sp. TRM95111]|uniref:glycosyltransferase family 10 domain-containing protein n=1 Tax=Rhizobium alarense TaxID=2846851 RepID=UPI001F2719D3|nr:glycosyltransferase family 10 [Rhizobium alarense]MCF3638471.1 glycosyltransferase family 10 [Rhizobium alarense]
MIRIFSFGSYRNRQPLAYLPIAQRLAGQVVPVDRIGDAQIVLFSHSKDLTLHEVQLTQMLAVNPRLRLVLLSEEPFWDTCWNSDPFTRHRTHETGLHGLPYIVLNHHTSGIYDSGRIPYFLLTDPGYIARYRALFDRNAGWSTEHWRAQFKAAAYDVAFVGAKRHSDEFAPAFPKERVWGLSVFRSDLASNCDAPSVLRAGRGWSDGPMRTELEDWHADKLALLDLRCRYVSALENTHQPNYVSEKIFDAFAVGGVPLYFATPRHDVHRLVAKGGWVNLYRSPVPAKPYFDATQPVSDAMLDDYALVQAHLARLFRDKANVEAELDRLAEALVQEFATVLRS